MQTYELELFDSHPLIKSEGGERILIDTGSPATIGSNSRLIFAGREYDIATEYIGVTTKTLGELLGTEIDALVGADILSEYKILIDYAGGRLTLDRKAIEFSGESCALEYFMGIPIIELEIGGKAVKCFLDTGAKLSYLDPGLLAGRNPVGEERDFYPGLGTFTTATYLVETTLGATRFPVRYGELPPLLQMSLMTGGAGGIIGSDIFNHFVVLLDAESESLVYKPA
ncbi:MAG: hypothetical protein JSS81_27350 [Acidobacteria bacterium]|nr:hypothetical protein [Acidobacteriota bacterium]